MISRRKILIGAAGLGSMAILGCAQSVFTGRDMVHSSLKGDNQNVKGVAGISPVEMRILRYASLAPSGHNTQPWRVRVDGPGLWVIGVDEARRLPVLDPHNREVMLSLGAFVENLVLAAGALGFSAEVEVIAENPGDLDVLRVRLASAKPTGYSLGRIESRMTPKNGYRPELLTRAEVEALGRDLPGHLHYFPKGSEHARCMAEGTVECMRLQLQRKDAMEETARWFRLRDAEVRKHRDGLTVEGMEIQGLSRFLVRHFVSPEDMIKPANLKRTLDLTARLASEGAGWMVITSEGNRVADWIEAGRRFERMALTAREHGIGLHPMTQILEESAGRGQISEHHAESMIPQFVLRVGRLNPYPEPVSPRRPVGRFVGA